jgi:predicted protein tyrosine phosphatase
MPPKSEAEMARALNRLAILDIEERYRVPVLRKRQEISAMFAENKYNDPEVWQALMDYDILLGELLQRYEEVENVMEHLFEYYLISEYSQTMRVPLKNIKSIPNDKNYFQTKLEDILEQKASIERNKLTIALYSIRNMIERELRIVGDYNMLTLYKIDNELLNLKMMYEYLIENFKENVTTKI